jgi:hypothetical protein
VSRFGDRRHHPHSSRGAAFGDYDNDGDVDVLVMNMNEPPSLLRNDYAGRTAGCRCARGHALEPVGDRRDRARDGGGRTTARTVLSQSSYGSHDDLRLHFGLGAASRADAIEVVVAERAGGPAEGRRGRRVVRVREGQTPSR